MTSADPAGDQTELVGRSHLSGHVERVWVDERSSDWRDLSDHHLRRLGISSGAEFHRLVLQGTGARLGWVVWLWGVSTDDPHAGPRGRRLYRKVVTSTEDELWVRAVRIELRRCSGTYGELDYEHEAPSVIVEWPDAGLSPGQVSVCGLPFTGNKLPRIQDVRPAFEILAAVGKGGRPKGAVKGRVWSRREILEWYEEASAEYAQDGSPARLRDLGDAVGVSEDTAGERVRGAEPHWPPTQEELDELNDE